MYKLKSCGVVYSEPPAIVELSLLFFFFLIFISFFIL